MNKLCGHCHARHDSLLSCSRAARLAEVAARQAPPAVVHKLALVVHAPLAVVHAPDGSPPSKHGRYADLAARKAYKRDWMRRKRASGETLTSAPGAELATLT